MFGVMHHLRIAVCEDFRDAVAKGFDYKAEEYAGITAVEVDTVVVVQNGTMAGNPTVDLLLVDEKGNKYVVMVTGALLKSIPC